jgi:hypothetical protein
MNIDSIDSGYNAFLDKPSNVNEHFPALKIYAQQCAKVAQFGCSDMLSCWPLLHGMSKSGESSGERKLVCFDKGGEPEGFQNLKKMSRIAGVKLYFIQQDTLKLDLQPVDMLLIDTFHTYVQLKRELERHHDNVQKYIAILNTSIDDETSELVRMFYFYDIDAICKDLSCSHADVCKGLAPAINEFIAEHPTWKIHKSFANNNGLVVLQRSE